MFAKSPACNEALRLSDEAGIVSGYRLWHLPGVKYQKDVDPETSIWS